jgi:peptide/nickel transport system substrate-binding protein
MLGRRFTLWMVTAVMLVGCSSPAQPSAPAGSSPGQAPPTTSSGPKRITLAALVDPGDMRDGRARPFIPYLGVAGLTTTDEKGERHPQLSENVPNTQDGTWQVFADGRMQTTWRIREGARWHDGTPFTGDDLIFTHQVAQERDQNIYSRADFDLIEAVEAPDPRTVVVKWKRPYIEADSIFSMARIRYTVPAPRHLLERPFLENKAQLDSLPYWTTDYVGLGAYRMREWVPSSHALFEAFPEYVLGRPKIDQIEVKFILDPNTLTANVLAGSIDVTASRALSIEQGVAVREQWQGGKMGTAVEGWTMAYPQHHHPSPTILGEAQFRRALVHAIDRQELAETLSAGFSAVAHSIISPDAAEYRAVENSIVKYDYDPRRSIQILEGMGLARGSDGMFRDRNGDRLAPLKIQTTVNDTSTKTTFATVDAWQQVGLPAEGMVLPPQGVDNRYAYTGFDLVNQDINTDGIVSLLHSSAAPLPERNYRAPASARNRGSYVNPEYDALMDRYVSTIPMPERMQALSQLVRWQTDEQLVIGFFYSVNAVMVSNRMQNVVPATTWNVHQWDVR